MNKIKFYTFFLFIILPVLTNAQFEVGKSYLGPSLGLSFLGSVPQIGINYEHGINLKDFGNVGFGGILRYWSYNDSFVGGEWSYSDFLIGAQGNYHFKLTNEKIDLWAGLVLAFDAGYVKYKGDTPGIPTPSHGGLWLGLQGGCRYWLSPTFALSGRLGLGTLSYSSLEIGCDWKF
jgi:hypothetical protein